MKLSPLSEQWTLRLITITPLAALAIMAVVITSFYIEKLDYYFKSNADRYLSEYIEAEKRQGERYVKEVVTLATFSDEHLEDSVKKSLDERMRLAHRTASYIYDKYHGKISDTAIKERIIDALYNMRWFGRKNYVWITDYEGNNILTHSPDLNGKNISALTDVDGRAIILEEIHMARKYGEGYIKTRFRVETSTQIEKVVDFGHFGWYFGTGIHLDRALQEKKAEIIALIEKAPKERFSYIAIFEENTPLYFSEEAKNDLDAKALQQIKSKIDQDAQGWIEFEEKSLYIYGYYCRPFNWTILYGFKKASFSSVLKEQQLKSKAAFDAEIERIVLVTAGIAFLIALLSFIVSRNIIAIIRDYKKSLEEKEQSLRDLNASLEERVLKEVDARREKEKMLIQQSKMAAMGDMISMIAHQWRQPLNQISYILMNIESAYEYKEMTPEYMDKKVKEGSQLLEYMSHTIDDFRNFFKPDKERSDEKISEVITQTLSIVQKSLDAHNVKVHLRLESQTHLLIYRNELLQVLLNLIGNARDAVLAHGVDVPKITIHLYEDADAVIITVSDNGGGVDESIKEKIFEPYFSTKGEKSGTGLGLYMVKTIIEGHLNGEISVENAEEGASFRIRLFKEV